MKLKVYTGLSLTDDEVHAILPDAVVAAPIRRGELTNDVLAGVQVVAVIDGEFDRNMAVTPTEILDALRCGVKVYGSSSMGAMRAAELHAFGMVGHGAIFEHIVAQPYFADDHLGQIFFTEGPFRSGIPAIDVVLGLEELRTKKIVDDRTARAVARRYLGLHFTERTVGALRAMLRDNPRALKMLGRLSDRKNSTKRTDGLGLLRRIKRDLARVRKLNARFARRA